MKKLRILILALLMLSLLCACGSSDYDSAASEGYAVGDYGTGAGYGYAEEELYWEESSDNGYAVGSTSAVSTDASADFDGDKIIYSGSASIETMDFDQCCADVQQMINQVGGFLESSCVYGVDYYVDGHRYAEYTIRIPREQFDSVTQNLSGLGNVSYISIEAENVGAEYHDTESHLAVYRTEEERLLDLLEQAETVEDMLYIEERLADVRYSIEALTTQLSSWDSLINYSTLNLNISEVVEYTVEPEQGYWAKIGTNFVNTLKGVGSFFAGFFAFLIAALPVLLILAAIAFVVVKLIRRGCKRRAAKKQAAAAEKAVSDTEETAEKE